MVIIMINNLFPFIYVDKGFFIKITTFAEKLINKMSIKYYFLGLIWMMGVSCSPTMSLAEVKPQRNIHISKDISEKKELTAVIAPYKQQLEQQMNQKIAHTSIALDRNGDNSSLGEVLVDFLHNGANAWMQEKAFPKIDATILNIGGIRNNIAKGDILVKHIFEVMPFENEVVIVKIKGEDIPLIFEYYAQSQRNNPVSGLNIEVDNGKIIRGQINGEAPQKGREYYIATSDYLALGGDYMNFFAKGEMIATGVKLRDLFMKAFQEAREVQVKGDIRLKFNKPNNE